jgi:hypothetical protein
VGSVLKRQVSLTEPTYTYLNADLVSDFGGEPASFRVRVRNVNGAFESDNIEIIVSRLT